MSKINDNFSKFSEYAEAAKNFLSNCQTIEAGLCLYIISSYDYIRLNLGNRLPFHFSKQDIKKDSMGTLVEKFNKLTNNYDLISRLKELIPYRNKCAHHAFVLKVQQLQSNDTQFESDTKELINMFDKAETVYHEVVKSYKALENQLKQLES